MAAERRSKAGSPSGTRAPALRPARVTVPILEHFPVRLGGAELEQASRLAQRLLESERALSSTDAFGKGVAAGLDGAPAVLFEDHSEISLFTAPGDVGLQYRSLLLAGDDDIVVISGGRSEVFESYCEQTLRLGQPTVLSVAPHGLQRDRTIPHRCVADPDVLGPIIETARRHRKLNLVPYIGTGNVWRLAGLIAAQANAAVNVSAPPPRLTQRVNDKLWFSARVTELLGTGALPPSYHAFGPAALTGRVSKLARAGERVIVKVPDSAGSAGNLVIDSEMVWRLPLSKLRQRILRLLSNLGWVDQFPLMVGVWECAVLSSPSVQIWVPRRDEGPPVVEGLFDQVVEGAAGSFVGALPCALPQEWCARIAEEAMLIAQLFQNLGYFGRCSFDALLSGEDYASARLHWIECNGRWGGTSIPMTLANRLLGDWWRRSMMIIQRTELKNVPCDLATALDRLDPLLFRGDGADGGVIVLTPAGLEAGTGLHFLLLAENATATQDLAQAVGALFASKAE